jgi:hypothetical protein
MPNPGEVHDGAIAGGPVIDWSDSIESLSRKPQHGASGKPSREGQDSAGSAKPYLPHIEVEERGARVKLANEIQQRFSQELLQTRRFDHANPADMEPVRGSVQVGTKRGAVDYVQDPARAKARFDELGSQMEGPYHFINPSLKPDDSARSVTMVPLPDGQPGDMLAQDGAGNFKVVSRAELSAQYTTTKYDLRSMDYLLRVQKQCAEADPSSTDCNGNNLSEGFARHEATVDQMLKSGALAQLAQEKSGPPKVEPFNIENVDGRRPPEAAVSPRETPKEELARALKEVEPRRVHDPETQVLVERARELLEHELTDEQIKSLQRVQEMTEIRGKGAAALFLLTTLLGKCTQNAAGSDTLKAK